MTNNDDNFGLNDVVISNRTKDGSANIKKILTAVAILIILFLIVLIIMKFINKGNIDTSAPITMPSEEQINKPVQQQTPEVKIVQNTKVTEAVEEKKETPNENVVKVEPIKVEPLKVEPLKVEPLKVEPLKVEPVKIEPISVEPPKENSANFEVKKEEPIKVTPIIDLSKVAVKNEPVKTIKEEKKPEIKKEAPKPQIQPAQVKKETPKIEPKKENLKVIDIKKEEPKKAQKTDNSQKPTQKAQIENGTLKSGNYIQVTSLSQSKPDAAYLKKITDKGYNYVIHKSKTASGKETLKILVGPFDTGKINGALSDLRKDINKDAFIHRVK